MEKFEKFWKWFQVNAKRLQATPHPKSLLSVLNQKLENLGVTSWEIGPNGDGLFFLAISPGGDIDKLPLTKSIVACAPVVTGWIFLHAKPPKLWKKRVFLWNNDIGLINADNWRIVVYKFEDRKYEIIFFDKEIESIDETERDKVLRFVTESEIGEETFFQKVLAVDFISCPTDLEIASSIGLGELKGAIR